MNYHSVYLLQFHSNVTRTHFTDAANIWVMLQYGYVWLHVMDVHLQWLLNSSKLRFNI